MTDAEVRAAASALEQNAEGRSFAARLAPHNVWAVGARRVIEAADQTPDQTPEGRLASGERALRGAIDATGHGAMVSDEDCREGAAIVLAAVHKLRATAATQGENPKAYPATSVPTYPDGVDPHYYANVKSADVVT